MPHLMREYFFGSMESKREHLLLQHRMNHSCRLRPVGEESFWAYGLSAESRTTAADTFNILPNDTEGTTAVVKVEHIILIQL